MRKVVWSLAARVGALLLFFFFLFLVSLPNLIDLDNFRPQLLQLLRAEIAGPVEIGRIGLTFHHGPGIKIDDVKVVDKSGKQHIAADEVIVNFRLHALFQRRLQVAGLVLVRPRVELEFSDPDTFLSGFVKPSPPSQPVIAEEHRPVAEPAADEDPLDLGGGWHFSPKFNHAEVQIVDGRVVFIDSWTGVGPVTTHLEGLKLSVKWYGTGAPAQFALSSRVVNGNGRADGYLRIDGILASLHFPFDPAKIYLDGRIEARNLDGTKYFPYYSEHVPMRKIGGLVDIDTTYQGSLMGLFHARGRIVLRRVEFDYPEMFEHKLTAERLSVDCDFRLADHYNTIEIKDCTVDLDGFRILGQCLLHDVRSYVDGKIDANFTVPDFDPVTLVPWLPAGFLPEEVDRGVASLAAGGRCEIPRAYLHCRYRQLMALDGPDPPSGIIGAELQGKNLVFKVPGINPAQVRLSGRLEFADTSIKCDNVAFSWGGLNGRKCSGWLKDLYREPRFSFSAGLDVELASFWQQILQLPAEERLQKAPGDGIESRPFSLNGGRVAGRIGLRGSLQAPEKLICRGRLKAVDTAFTVPGLTRPVTGFSGEFALTDSGLSLNAGHGRLGEMAFSLSARTDVLEKLYADWEKESLPIDVRLDCPEIAPTDLNSLLLVQEKLTVQGRAASPSHFVLHARGDFFKPEALKIDGLIDLDWADLVMSGFPRKLNVLQVKTGFKGLDVDCEKLYLKAGRSDFAFQGKAAGENGGRKLKGSFISHRLFLDDFLQASESSEKLHWPAGLEIDLAGKIDSLYLPSQGGFRPLGQDSYWQRLSRCELSLSAGPRTGLDLRRCAWLWGEQKSSFSLTGKLDSFPDFKGHLELQVDDLDLDRLLQTTEVEMATEEEDGGEVENSDAGDRVTAFTEITDVVEPDQVKAILAWKKWLAPHQVDLKISARRLILERLLIDRISGEIRLDRRGIMVDRLDGHSFEGNIYVSGEWLFDGDSFDLDIDLNQINLEKLNDYLDNPNRGFPMQGGMGSLVVALDWEGEDLKSWRKNLDGLVEFNFRDGKMKRFTLIGNICSLLNVSQFASLKLPEFSSGVPYKTLTGRGTILSGVAEIDDFTLKGPAVNLMATGKVDFVKQKVNLKFGIQPLQSVDKLLASIPVLGYIMTGDKKTFVIVPVSVEGPFDDVKITTKSIKGMGEKAGDMIKRFFKTPIRLLGLGGKGSGGK